MLSEGPGALPLDLCVLIIIIIMFIDKRTTDKVTNNVKTAYR